MNISKAYSEWATTYDSDRNLTRDLDQIVTRNILGQGHYAAILELGCGTGKNTPLLAQIGDRVTAFDFSDGMIQQAKAKLEAANVSFAVVDLTQPWPCANNTIDLMTCNLVLEHIADLPFVFAEAYRVATKQGQFFISELHPFKQYQGKKATFNREQQQIEIPAFIHHISSFLDAAEEAGFKLKQLREWWHTDDQDRPPRLVTFVFQK